MTTPPATFSDPDAQRQFDQQGFVVFRGLARDHVPDLRALYHETHDTTAPSVDLPDLVAPDAWKTQTNPGASFAIGVDEADEATRIRIHEGLQPVWRRIFAEHLTGHRALLMSFLMKWPGEFSALPLHQDPTIVDERRYRSLTVWIPLVDTSVALDNGPLYVIPGSHTAGDEARGTGTSPTYYEFFDQLWPLAVPIEMQAGDGLWFDSRILHGSPPNRSGEPRLAVGTAIAPTEANLVHAMARPDGDVDLLSVDDDFYRTMSPRQLTEHPPAGMPVADTIPMKTRPYTPAAVAAGAAAYGRADRSSRRAKVLGFFQRDRTHVQVGS